MLEGCITALITPFDETGAVDYKALDKIIDYQINSGIHGLLFLGTTGEASTMSEQEKADMVKHCVKYVNHRVPVVVGAGGNNTKKCVERAKTYEELGVDYLLEVTPYYNKTSQSGLIAHYTQIANAVSIPIILYNVPSRTGMNIETETLYELSKIENVVGIKQAVSNMEAVMQTPMEMALFSGEDALNYVMLTVGAKGFISVVSNVLPNRMAEVYELFKRGQYQEAKETMDEMQKFCKLMFCEVNPMPVKYAMNAIGFKAGGCRLPLVEISNKNKQAIREELVKFFEIKDEVEFIKYETLNTKEKNKIY